MKVLGISAFYHDSAVAAVEDGQIRFAIQEERLSRVKHDARFPILALAKALEHCRWTIDQVDEIVFYEQPELKLQRIWGQVLDGWPRTWPLFRDHLPRFYRSKYPVERILREQIRFHGRVRFVEHHVSHAASAFYVSPFEEALVLTADGVGEFESTTVSVGSGNDLRKVGAIHFPDSLGLLYSVFTQFLGFEVNEGEYKVMGLAPYGKPRFVDRILDHVLRLHDDGSYHLNQRLFDFANRDRHFTDEFQELFGIPAVTKKEELTEAHRDLAASIQRALEVALENLLRAALARNPTKNVCMAGGVALNCTANSHLVRTFGINLFVQPAAGDAGGALGAAMAIAVRERPSTYRFPFQPYLGTRPTAGAIDATLRLNNLTSVQVPNIMDRIADRLAAGDIVAIVQGRDEWGPRALGNRSILANPAKAEMKDHLNAKIKFREEFRPFAPIVMEEHFSTLFETLGQPSAPFMLFTHRAVQPGRLPAAVHADSTSRVQTVSRQQNPYMYGILESFYRRTGLPALINTSFNLRGEPVVSSASDALKTFYNSGIDHLALEDRWISKETSTRPPPTAQR